MLNNKYQRYIRNTVLIILFKVKKYIDFNKCFFDLINTVLPFILPEKK